MNTSSFSAEAWFQRQQPASVSPVIDVLPPASNRVFDPTTGRITSEAVSESADSSPSPAGGLKSKTSSVLKWSSILKPMTKEQESMKGTDLEGAMYTAREYEFLREHGDEAEKLKAQINELQLGEQGQDAERKLDALVAYLLPMFSEEASFLLSGLALTGASTWPQREWSYYWSKAETNWRTDLSKKEDSYYRAMPPKDQAVFRIVRNIAKNNSGLIFMSDAKLKKVVPGLNSGWRSLMSFDRLKIIRVLERGKKHQEGVRGVANKYLWVLADFTSLPPAKRSAPGNN